MKTITTTFGKLCDFYGLECPYPGTEDSEIEISPSLWYEGEYTISSLDPALEGLRDEEWAPKSEAIPALLAYTEEPNMTDLHAKLAASPLWARDNQTVFTGTRNHVSTRIAKPVKPGVDHIMGLTPGDPDVVITPIDGEYYADLPGAQVYSVRKWGYLYMAALPSGDAPLEAWQSYCAGQKTKTIVRLDD